MSEYIRQGRENELTPPPPIKQKQDDTLVKNPNPAANENLVGETTTDNKDSETGSEITDGEDA